MLAALLDRYQPEGDAETADVGVVRALTGTAADPYQRDLPLHIEGLLGKGAQTRITFG